MAALINVSLIYCFMSRRGFGISRSGSLMLMHPQIDMVITATFFVYEICAFCITVGSANLSQRKRIYPCIMSWQ